MGWLVSMASRLLLPHKMCQTPSTWKYLQAPHSPTNQDPKKVLGGQLGEELSGHACWSILEWPLCISPSLGEGRWLSSAPKQTLHAIIPPWATYPKSMLWRDVHYPAPDNCTESIKWVTELFCQFVGVLKFFNYYLASKSIFHILSSAFNGMHLVFLFFIQD